MSSIDIRTIKILLDTNIPGKEVVQFTKSTLYEPEIANKNGANDKAGQMPKAVLNELPYFTMDIEYPESYLVSLPYTKQVEFFFNKQKMTEILQLKTTIKPQTQQDGLTPKSVEKKIEEDKQKERIQEQRSESIEMEQSKQRQIQQEKRETDEKEDKKAKIDMDEEKALKDLSTKLSSNINVLQSKTIEKIEGKRITVNNEFDEYITTKKVANEEIVNTVKTMVGLEQIKEIFKPNEEYLKGSSGGFLFMFQGENKNNIDENNLYKSEFCDNKKKENTIRLFNINPSTPKWEPYKEGLLSALKSVQSNPLFDISGVDGVIKVISEIETQTIDYDKYNSTEDPDKDKWKEIDEQLCGILSKIRTAFDGMKDIQTALEKYPEEANKKMDVFVTEYENKKAELEKSNKEDKDNIEQSFFEKKNEQEMFGGGRIVRGGGIEGIDTQSQHEISEKNVMIMIRLLFPTKYPILGNVFSSFHSVITGKNEFHLKWTDFIPGFLKQNFFEGMNEYSYIKVDGKVYTVIQAIWLNDIYNHKEYKKLVEQFEQLQKWKIREARKSEINVGKRGDQIIETFTTNPEYEINDIDIKNIQDTLKINLTSKGAEYSLAEYKLSVESLIDIMKRLMIAKNSKKKDNIIEFSKKFSDLFLQLQKERMFNPLNKQKYEKIATKIKEEVDKYEADKHILKVYLQSPGINMDYDRDKYRNILEQKYGLYIRFIENIRKYRAPILESSNNFLQNSIDDFLNKTEKYKGVFNFLMNPLNMKKNPYEELITKNIVSDVTEKEDIEKEQKTYLNRFHTGVTIRPSAQAEEPYYEIYIQLNLLGGELNDSNKSAIDCIYQGESLGDKLSRILNEAIYHPWNINSSRVFFDITQGAAKDAMNKLTTNNKNTEQSQQSTQSQQGGGKKNTRKYRELFLRNTRKHYS